MSPSCRPFSTIPQFSRKVTSLHAPCVFLFQFDKYITTFIGFSIFSGVLDFPRGDLEVFRQLVFNIVMFDVFKSHI